VGAQGPHQFSAINSLRESGTISDPRNWRRTRTTVPLPRSFSGGLRALNRVPSRSYPVAATRGRFLFAREAGNWRRHLRADSYILPCIPTRACKVPAGLTGQSRTKKLPSIDSALFPVPIGRRSRLKRPRLAPKSILRAKLLTPIGYLQCAYRQGGVAEAEERPRHFLRATPRSFSSSRPRGCRAEICEIAVNARSNPNVITPGQHEHRVSYQPRPLRVVVTGALLVALGLGCFGGANWFLSRSDELADSTAAPAPPVNAPAPTVAAAGLSGDLAAVKQAIDLMREGKTGEVTGIKKSIDDPVARKVVEWLILRHPSGDAGFGRYAAFIADNPSWPGIGLLRRRAEGRLWQERSEAATVRRFTGGQPASAKGRFTLARVLLAEGDRDGAGRRFARPGGRKSYPSTSKPRCSAHSASF
jgi:hypothetical protein